VDAELAENMAQLSVDLLPGVKPWEVDWRYCSGQGEECTCKGTIRYGHAGKAEHYFDDGIFFHRRPNTVRWMMRPGGGSGTSGEGSTSVMPVTCDATNFGDRDPFPEIREKVCQCAEDLSVYQLKITGIDWGAAVGSFGAYFAPQHSAVHKFKTCAEIGGSCECDGAVRFGQPSYAVDPAEFSHYWKDIVANIEMVNDVEGKWWVLGGVTGRVNCTQENFETSYNKMRINQAIEPITICQCLQGDTYYKSGDKVYEYQILSLANVSGATEAMAELAMAYLRADQELAITQHAMHPSADGETAVGMLGQTFSAGGQPRRGNVVVSGGRSGEGIDEMGAAAQRTDDVKVGGVAMNMSWLKMAAAGGVVVVALAMGAMMNRAAIRYPREHDGAREPLLR